MYVNLLEVLLLLVFPVAIEAKDFKLFSDLAFVSLLLGSLSREVGFSPTQRESRLCNPPDTLLLYLSFVGVVASSDQCREKAFYHFRIKS